MSIWRKRSHRRVVGALILLTLSACEGAGDDDPEPLPPPDGAVDPPMEGGQPPDGQTSLPTPDGSSLEPPLEAGALPVDAGFRDDATVLIPDSGHIAVPRPPDTGLISFRPCAEGTRDCGSMKVPVDHEDASGNTLSIAVMRRRASGTRLGTLLINPGGPGTSAIDFLGDFVTGSTSPLLAHFDLVAFDPRGVGYSTGLDCHDTLQQLYAVDPTPDDEAEWQLAIEAALRFANDCKAAHEVLLPHLSTRNVARDMDRVRAALGEEKLRYLGFSYGSSIGAHYAELFPERIAAMVLDAPVDLELSALDLALEQAKGFERSLERYFAWCRAQPSKCTFARGADPKQAFTALASTVEQQPIPAPTADRPVGPGELVTAVGATLYLGEVGWGELSTGLEAAVSGDGSTLMIFVDGYLKRDDATKEYPNLEEANHAVNCLDRKPMSVAEIRAAAPRFASEAPFFGLPALVGQLVCAQWPVGGQNAAVPRGTGAPPLVVIGTLNDPATPYSWAAAFAADLRSAVLLTSLGDGHTAYGRADACINSHVHAYLFDGITPMMNACGAPPLPRLLGAQKPKLFGFRR